VTGASGEMAHALLHRLTEDRRFDVLALDVRPLDPELGRRCAVALTGDIRDRHLLERLRSEFEIHAIYHLAAILSTRAEFVPEAAHQVNVEGTLNLLRLAVEEARWHGHRVRFLFPSSIAVYGLPDLETKRKAGAISEAVWTLPITMYGCNKLYGEHLGRYYSRHFGQLAAEVDTPGIDFRAIRFPGLMSAFTTPSGGTSDYAPEMLHAAAQGREYACFVREDTRIPLMAMPDAVDALLALANASVERLGAPVYNVTAFNPSAGQLADLVRGAFPGARIAFRPDQRRQRIVDSWPEDLDDAGARRDWGFRPRYDLDRALHEYLVPNIRQRYGGA
jgi:nucleoside-diphosphate-sugar epimerase